MKETIYIISTISTCIKNDFNVFSSQKHERL